MTPFDKAKELGKGLVTIAATHQVRLDFVDIRDLQTSLGMPMLEYELVFNGKASNEAWWKFAEQLEDEKFPGYSVPSPLGYKRNEKGEVDTELGLSFKIRVAVEH